MWYVNIFESVRAGAKMFVWLYRLWYLASNGIIVKTYVHEQNLLFEGKKCVTLISRKRCHLAQKMDRMTFVDFYICHRMVSLRKTILMTLTYFWRSQIWNFSMSESVTAGEKMHGTTFVVVDIFHRIASLQYIIFVDLDLLFEVKNFKCQYQ